MAALTRAQIFKLLFSGGNYAKQYLIKLYHPVAGVLRYVNNNQDIAYDGNVYKAAGFDYTPPDSQNEGGILEISGIDNYEIMEWLEKADDRYTMEVMGALNDGEVQPIRAYKHFYGTVSMSENNTLNFSLESDGRLGMVFTVYKYDTDLNRGNA